MQTLKIGYKISSEFKLRMPIYTFDLEKSVITLNYAR